MYLELIRNEFQGDWGWSGIPKVCQHKKPKFLVFVVVIAPKRDQNRATSTPESSWKTMKISKCSCQFFFMQNYIPKVNP